MDSSQTLSWRDLEDRVARFAGGLQEAGLQPGDRVAILARNRADYLIFVLGTWWAGGVINPLNARWSAAEVAYALDDSQTRLLFAEDHFSPLLEEISAAAPGIERIWSIGGMRASAHAAFEPWLAAASPVADAMRGGEQFAALMYSGGTTGRPKGVMLSHWNFFSSISGALTVARPCQSYLYTAPLFHVGGLAGLLTGVYTGTTCHFLPVFDPVALLELVERHRIEETFMVPTMMRAVIDHPRFKTFDSSSLRRIRYGASSIDAALMDRLLAEFPDCGFVQAYGMTELSPIATMLDEADHGPAGVASGKLRTAGRAIPTAEVRIVGADGAELPRGEIGEIVVRGPGVMLGYWNRPDLTAEAIRDGWMHTGDLGFMDAEAYVSVVDRLKDMIISGGENVYSAEVEAALSTHAGVAQCAVVGLPDERWGERVHAFIIRRPNESVEPDALTDHCRSRIAGYKIPKSYAFVAEFPLSAAGKILKNELRKSAIGALDA